MAIQKNFVVKNGIEVNTNLIFGDTGSSKVGIATTNPKYTLHVNGGIGATSLSVTGISTVNNLTVNGRVTAGSSLGAAGQYLVSTGTGVTWGSVPTVRSSDLQTAGVGATTFSTTYSVGLLDVYINGVKLSSDEFTANNGATVVLDDACFGGETVEFISYSPFGIGVGGSSIQGITILEEGSPVGSALQVTSINFVGAAVTAVGSGIGVTVYVNDSVNPNYWASTGAGIHTLSNVGLGTTNPRFALEVGAVGASGTTLYVNGDARITGILTVGTSSITLNGATNTVNVGSGVTIDGTAGTISATTFVGDGSGLVNVVGSGSGIVVLDDGSTVGTAGTIDFGANLSVSAISAGVVTVTASGGASTQWETTAAGINTLSSVGIGTTNPTSALTVKGNTSLETLNVSGISTFSGRIKGPVLFSKDGSATAAQIVEINNDGSAAFLNVGGSSSFYFDSPNTNIRNTFTGGRIRMDSPSGIDFEQYGLGGAYRARFEDTNVSLYSSNSLKFQTIGAGVTVTGTTFTNDLSVSGIATFAGSNVKINAGTSLDFGTGAGDLHIYRQSGGSNDSIIKYDGSYNFKVLSDITTLASSAGSVTWGVFGNNGVELYYSNSKKFETLGTGVTVTGTTFTNQLNVSGVSTFSGTTNLTTTNISGDLTFTGNNDIYLKDGGVINFGDGNDLQIFHNGSVSVIRDGGTGGLLIDSDNEVKIAKNGTGNDNLAVFTPDGSVELYYDNSKKFETLGAGVTVTGTTFTNDLSVSGIATANSFRARGGAPGALGVNNNGYGFFGSGDNDSGMYSSADGEVEFYSNSSEVFRYNGTGVGIGTTNPTSKLTVRGGDISVGVSTAHGVILTSPNGTQYRLIVDNSGTLSTVAV